MARKPTQTTPTSRSVEPAAHVVAANTQAVNQLAVIELNAESRTLELAAQLGYDGATSVGALEDGIRFYQQRTAEACLQMGVRLLLLKEACAHGDFKQRVELLGVEYTAATRFMAVARKFSKVATSQLLKAANTQGKLLELLVLDDEEVADLEAGRSVAGITVDDVDRMGVREMRKALRDARAEKTADDAILEKKNKKLDQLQRRIAKLSPDEVLKELQVEATGLMNDALGAVRGGLRQALIALQNHGDDDHTLFMAGLVGQVQADLAALREEFRLPDVSTAAERELAAEVAEWSGN